MLVCQHGVLIRKVDTVQQGLKPDFRSLGLVETIIGEFAEQVPGAITKFPGLEFYWES